MQGIRKSISKVKLHITGVAYATSLKGAVISFYIILLFSLFQCAGTSYVTTNYTFIRKCVQS